jgi:hypothetical protein
LALPEADSDEIERTDAPADEAAPGAAAVEPAQEAEAAPAEAEAPAAEVAPDETAPLP